MSEHTAGWSVEFQELGGYDCMTAAYYIKAVDGSMIAELDLRDYGQDNNGPYDVAAPRALANAQLIAAAPELLAALEACRDELSFLHTTKVTPRQLDKLIASSSSAIAKARGQEVNAS